jgi:Trk K+ transport system NAD-binding subunit
VAGGHVVSVQRGDHLLFPGGDTVMQPGDVVSVRCRPENADDVRLALARTTQPLAEPAKRGPEFV